MTDESDWSTARTGYGEHEGAEGPAAPRHPDWPGPGPLDLRVHDLPHRSSSIEWWYVNAHLTTAAGRPYSLFASFFRVDAEEAEGPGAASARTDPQRRRSHFVIWAITDVHGRAYHMDSRLDPQAPADGLDRLDRGRGGQDPRIRRALREVFAKGQVPLPDRLLEAEGVADQTRLHLDYGRSRFEKLEDGSYRLDVADAARGLSAGLTFTPQKPPIRHGADGVVCTRGDTEMFYYFVPRCRVEGALQVGGEALAVTGSGWYDHEFGTSPGEESGPTAAGQAWNWIGLQLDDGTDVTVFAVVDARDGRVLEHRAIVVDAVGTRRELTEFTFEPRASWTSCSTFNAYPTRWRLELPAVDGALDVECTFPEQEFVTLLSPPAFWEGRVEATGTLRGRAVKGLGYVERTGFCDVESLDDFFSAVGKETRKAIDALVPAAPSAAEAERALGGDRWRESLAGLDVDQYVRTVIAPIRHVVESGGKAWRSYGFLTCVDLSGGSVEEYRHWLALPELLHVGSLIVDDVEDRSDLRRGAPACHKLYGEALAINAGTACYFLAELVLAGSTLTPDKRARGYALYFEAMRAAHAGQALDIDGHHHLLPAVVESGDGAKLEARVLAVHRLKSAVPPAALARVATLIGDAPPQVGAGLSALFEAYGVAFQIVDDVLNLRGFENGLKDRGEDVRAGKVTAPVARAFSLLGLPGRRRLAEILTAPGKDEAQVAEAIALIDGCGALEACAAEARGLVESAWQRLDAILPDSQSKVRLRAFGWFILERHY